jgi:hypothetical protein
VKGTLFYGTVLSDPDFNNDPQNLEMGVTTSEGNMQVEFGGQW